MTTATAPNPAAPPAAAPATPAPASQAAPAPAAVPPAAVDPKAQQPAGGLLGLTETPEQKTAREKEAAAKPPAEYAFKLPEGHLISDKEVEGFKTLAKEKQLAPELAQSLLEGEAKRRQEYVDAQVATYRAQQEEQQKTWLTDLQTAFPGAQLKQAEDDGTRVIEKYGPPGFMQELVESGYARHKGLFTLLATVGRAMREDKFVPGAATAATGPAKSDAEVFFPGKK